MVKYGAIAVGTTLAVYGGYKLTKSGIISNVAGKSAVQAVNVIGKSKDQIDSKMLKSINDGQRFTLGGKMNCGHCSTSYILNSVLGKNTTATPFVQHELPGLSGPGGLQENVFDLIFDNITTTRFDTGATHANQLKLIGEIDSKIPSGSTGIMFVQDYFGNGHFTNIEKSLDGVTTIVDAQSGKLLSMKQCSKMGWLARSYRDCSKATLAEGAELYLNKMVKGL